MHETRRDGVPRPLGSGTYPTRGESVCAAQARTGAVIRVKRTHARITLREISRGRDLMLETDFVLVFKPWSKIDQRMALQSSTRFSLQFQFVAT